MSASLGAKALGRYGFQGGNRNYVLFALTLILTS